jgi:hypothetical protein
MSVTNVAVVFWYEHGSNINTLVANETKNVTEYLKDNEQILSLVRDKETTNIKKIADAKKFFATEAKKFTKMKIIPDKHIQFGEVIQQSNGGFKTTYRYVPDNSRFTIINGPVLEGETELEAIERIIIESTGYKVKKPELFLIEIKHDESLQKKKYTIFTHKIKESEIDKIFKTNLSHRQLMKNRGMYSNFKFIDASEHDDIELTGYSEDIIFDFVKDINKITFYNKLAAQGWQRVYSVRNNKYYWYNIKTEESTWDIPGIKIKTKTKKSKRGGKKTKKLH